MSLMGDILASARFAAQLVFAFVCGVLWLVGMIFSLIWIGHFISPFAGIGCVLLYLFTTVTVISTLARRGYLRDF